MNSHALSSTYIVIVVYLDVLLVLWLFSNRSSMTEVLIARTHVILLYMLYGGESV